MAIPSAISKRIHVACPRCGTFVTATRTAGIWSSPRCPQCREKVDLRQIRNDTIVCDNCKSVVAFNGLNAGKEFCPVCHSKLDPYQRKLVPCPYCGAEVAVQYAESQVQCPICDCLIDVEKELEKKKQQESQKAVLIQYGANTWDILWKHPQNSFPKGSRLIVREGSSAILLQNGKLHRVAPPGEYLLEDQELSLSGKMTEKGDFIYTTDIFFVQTRIAREFAWGTAYPSEIRDSYGTYTVRASGTLELLVEDPVALARHLNFQDLLTHGNGTAEADNLVADLVARQAGLCFGVPLQKLVREKAWNLSGLVKTDLQGSIQPDMDEQLRAFGLKLEPNSFVIQTLQCDEIRQSAQERDFLDRIQKTISFSAGRMKIHMKGEPACYAEFDLEGGVLPVVSDRNAFLNSSLAHASTPAAAVGELTGEVNRLLRDLFMQILQPMVDDTEADIREMGPYYSYLKSTACECLDFAMKKWGLSFGGMSFRTENFSPSPALRQAEAGEETHFLKLNDEKMRRFTQKIKLVENRETLEYELQILSDTVEINEAKAPLEEKKTEQEIAELDREERLTASRMTRDHRIATLKADHDLLMIRKEHEKDLAEAEHRVDMQDMLHRIDESDLSWREKLDAYARLQRNLDFSDGNQQTVNAAKADYEARHTGLQFTREQRELDQEMNDWDARRAEEARKADFQRDMESRRAAWEQEVKICQMESELFKYKIMMDFMSSQESGKAALEQARAAAEREYAERVRAQKERDDSTFFSRSRELMSQLRSFAVEMKAFSPEKRESVEKVIPGEFVEKLLQTLASVTQSVSTGPAMQSGFTDRDFWTSRRDGENSGSSSQEHGNYAPPRYQKP